MDFMENKQMKGFGDFQSQTLQFTIQELKGGINRKDEN